MVEEFVEEFAAVQTGESLGKPSDLNTWDRPEMPWWKRPEWTPPKKPDFEWWMSWQDESSISHKWVITFLEDANISGQTYSSAWDNEHAILVTWWTVTISDATIIKTWDSEWDSADFYWTNAAVIAVDGVLELNGDSINTYWAHANAVFAYGSGEIQISDSNVDTSGDNSWWIMVTWWGKLVAKNLTISTKWKSSAAIRSDRWGGSINVDGWTYQTSGLWSPAIYSTADITVKNAQLISTKSEWAIVEWKNSITILDSTLVDSNVELNWQSETYKNIFLYQSMSGDADEWTASFIAKNSKITTKNGDTIYVTNTKAKILLENNEISNDSWDFMRIEWAAWGKEGSNGWDVTLNLVNQDVEWNIIVDDISSLNMKLQKGSSFVWAINSENQSKDISLKLDENSSWTLQSDSYISEIQSDMTWYSNIDLNGYTLYVWEKAITSTDMLAQDEAIATVGVANGEWYSSNDLIIWWIWVVAIVVALWICISIYFKK